MKFHSTTYLTAFIFFVKLKTLKIDQCQYFKPRLPAMLFKEVDGKFSFEFDKDCLLERIFSYRQYA